jgi:hypothetical protein
MVSEEGFKMRNFIVCNFHIMYGNTIMIKHRRLRWAEHAAGMERGRMVSKSEQINQPDIDLKQGLGMEKKKLLQ